MKILRGNMIEEWLLESFVTQKEYDDSKYIEYIDNTCNNCEIENIQAVDDIIVESEDNKKMEEIKEDVINEENNMNSLEDNIEIISVQDTNEIVSVQTEDINNTDVKNKSMKKKKKIFIGRKGSKKIIV
jgi:hypothetical protein